MHKWNNFMYEVKTSPAFDDLVGYNTFIFFEKSEKVCISIYNCSNFIKFSMIMNYVILASWTIDFNEVTKFKDVIFD